MADYTEFTGQRVSLVRKAEDGGENVTVEGRVQIGNELGILIKPKGKTVVDMVEAENIVSIEAIPEGLKKVSQRKMRPTELSGVRAHLALYHGVALETVNDESYTDVKAAAYHDTLDHSALGHNHALADKDAAEDAAETADPVAAPTE